MATAISPIWPKICGCLQRSSFELIREALDWGNQRVAEYPNAAWLASVVQPRGCFFSRSGENHPWCRPVIMVDSVKAGGATMRSGTFAKKVKKPTFVAAMVVGAALSTLGAAKADAAVENVSRYCTACWRNARIQPDSWSDCTQEVFTRLLERVQPDGWDRLLARESEEHREFLRAIDAVKKRIQRAHRPTPLPGDVADDSLITTEERTELRREIMQAAHEHLTPRQAEIVSLSLDGWSVHGIAEQLQVSPTRVSDEKYKAVQRLRAALAT
jgi:RNA polymerase sigma factor (sigma-70 family)